MKYVMALDQGTTSSRCILFDAGGNVAAIAQKEFGQIYPHAGWVEHDALEIWSSQMGVAAEAMSKVKASHTDIAAIGITNQRETTVVWNKRTGLPICNAICWQCRRTAKMCDDMAAYAKEIKQKTGLVMDAYFSATKLAWILDNVPGAREDAEQGELLFGTIDTWLIWNMTRGRTHVTDYSNASRTMFFNIHELCWDEDILRWLDIPRNILPEVVPSASVYGYTDDTVLGGKIPIAGAAGDQQAALFGQAAFESGMAKNTYGTGCFLLMNTGARAVSSPSGLLTTIAWNDGKINYALEGSVFVAGAAVQWLRDEMQLIRTAAESEEWARSVPDTNGAYFIPAFVGLGAPWWDSYARGMITGITRGTNKAHIIRAALESLAYQTADILRLMEKDSGITLKALKVDGGASANDFLMQFQADILGVPVERPKCIETTALGAAYLAGLSVGFYKDKETLAGKDSVGKVFEPNMSIYMRAALMEGWEKAIAKCRTK